MKETFGFIEFQYAIPTQKVEFCLYEYITTDYYRGFDQTETESYFYRY